MENTRRRATANDVKSEPGDASYANDIQAMQDRFDAEFNLKSKKPNNSNADRNKAIENIKSMNSKAIPKETISINKIKDRSNKSSRGLDKLRGIFSGL